MTPLVLIPGMMCDARMWGGLAAHLSPRPVGHFLPTEADSIAALATGLLRNAPPRFALAGLSMGGTMVASAPLAPAMAGFAVTARIAGLAPPTEPTAAICARRMACYKAM